MSSYAAQLATPQIHTAIVSALRRRRVPPGEIGDLRQVVLAKALATQSPPATLEECEGLVRKIARDVAFDYFRRRSSRGKHDAGPCDNPDDHPAHPRDEDPIDVQEQIASVRRDIEQGRISPRQVDILERVVDGLPQTQIAQELGLAHQTVRNELSAARKTARRSWAAYAAVATVLCVIGVIWVKSRPEQVGAPTPVGPGTSSRGPLPNGAAGAGELRRKAIAEHDRGAWEDCLRDLEKAAALDPEGDRVAAVQALRGTCLHKTQPHPAP